MMNKMLEKFPLPWPIICDITEHDILQGTRCNKSRCPITYALKRFAKKEEKQVEITIGRNYSTIYCPKKRITWEVKHPQELHHWIDNFDHMRNVKPQRFEIASDALKDWKDPSTGYSPLEEGLDDG